MSKLFRRNPRSTKSIRKNSLPLELERLETRWLPAADLRDNLALALAPTDAGAPFDNLDGDALDLFAVNHHRDQGAGGGVAPEPLHPSTGGGGEAANASPTGNRTASADSNAAADMNAWLNWAMANNPGGGPNRPNRATAGAATTAPIGAPTTAPTGATIGKTGQVSAPTLHVSLVNPNQGSSGSAQVNGGKRDPAGLGPLITGGGMTLTVLDMNNGLILSPSVPVNDFSTYSVELDADVAGDTVTSYSWDTSHAGDATNVSGAGTYRLTFTWATFTSGVHSNTISVTATGSSSNTVSGTFKFLVTNDQSPAYSSTPPTTASTWLNLLPPDAVSDQQAMTGLGPYYQVGTIDGEMRTTQSFPAYNPNVPGLQLVYVSTAANIQPIFDAHYQLPPGVTVPGSVTAQLTFNGTALDKETFYVGNAGINPPLLNAGDTVQMGLIASNAQSLSTGRYSYSFQVVDKNANPMTTTYSGSADILNYKSNAFGAGWNLMGVEHIFSVTGGVILDLGDGQSLWFANGSTSGSFVTPPGDFSTLTQNTSTGVYTRAMPDGTQYVFSSSGYQTSLVDRNNNTTTYSYNASSQLTSIQDFNNQLETFAYSGSNVTTITDPANRVATLAYDGSGRLTSLQQADGSLWTYAYDSLNNITKLTNPLNNSATFSYSHARVVSATRMDGSVEQFNPVQLQALAAPVGNMPVSAPAADVGATSDNYTDPRGNVSNTYLVILSEMHVILAA
jgi:YD repeat-containing protein